MDIQMPHLSGEQVARAVRDEAGLNQHTPVVALTANAMPGERERLLGSGLDECLIKPISELQLVETLLHWADKQKTNPGPGRSTADHKKNTTTEEANVSQDELTRELQEMLVAELSTTSISGLSVKTQAKTES